MKDLSSQVMSTLSIEPTSFHIPDVLYQNRYCDQQGFSILVCGGKDKNNKSTNKVFEVNIPSFAVTEFPSMVNPHYPYYKSQLVNVNNDIFAISHSLELNVNLQYSVTSVEIYSDKNKTWKYQYVKTDEKELYSVCSFMKQLFVIGGWSDSNQTSLGSCCTYNLKCDKWSKIAHLHEARNCAACTVFEGKIVVTGGCDDDYGELESVEQYDYYEDKWTYLPDMIEKRRDHAAVSMGNKMFVIGGYNTTSCEAFDSISRIFTIVKSELNKPAVDDCYCEAFCIGNSILVFHHFAYGLKNSIVYLYDVNEEKWSKIDSDFTKNLYGPNCLKYYKQ